MNEWMDGWMRVWRPELLCDLRQIFCSLDFSLLLKNILFSVFSGSDPVPGFENMIRIPPACSVRGADLGGDRCEPSWPLLWLILLTEKSKGPPGWPRYLWALGPLLLSSMAATHAIWMPQCHNCWSSQKVHRYPPTEGERDLWNQRQKRTSLCNQWQE